MGKRGSSRDNMMYSPVSATTLWLRLNFITALLRLILLTIAFQRTDAFDFAGENIDLNVVVFDASGCSGTTKASMMMRQLATLNSAHYCDIPVEFIMRTNEQIDLYLANHEMNQTYDRLSSKFENALSYCLRK